MYIYTYMLNSKSANYESLALISGQFPMDLGSPPLELDNMLESKPPRSSFSAHKLAALRKRS